MNIYFFFSLYLNKLNDHKFVTIWETRFLNNLKNIIGILFIVYLSLTFMSGFWYNSVAGFFGALLFMVLVGAVLGYFMVIHFIKFLAIQNDRYFKIKTGQQNSNINYDNVVN